MACPQADLKWEIFWRDWMVTAEPTIKASHRSPFKMDHRTGRMLANRATHITIQIRR